MSFRPDHLFRAIFSALLLVTVSGCLQDPTFQLPGGPGPVVPSPAPPPAPPPPPTTPPPAPPTPGGPTIPTPTGLEAFSYGKWSPSSFDTCSKEQHDAYRVVGPDGKWYPTWHPPIDPASGCTFGHEHGRDPSGSNLFASIEPLAFGYANEVLMDAGAPTAHRHEDHVGHKIEWLNDKSITLGSEAMTCDVFVKLHQGTHSKDAFTNNVHEMFYHVACSNGITVNVRMLSPIGPAGEFTESCNLSNRIPAGVPTPHDSPNGAGDSRRRIPTISCYGSSDLTEQWSTFSRLHAADGAALADFNPYFKILNPSRTFLPEQADPTARPLDACRMQQIPDHLTEFCAGVGTDVTWDSPQSPFRGDNHSVAFNRLTLIETPHDVWFTDAYGQRGSPTEFPHSIRQTLIGSTAAGPGGRLVYLGARSGNFHAPGVHAPN